MALWVHCPVINLDLDKPPAQRHRNIPPEALAKGRRLLEAVTQEIPPAAKPLADLVRLRTQGRFHEEACSISRLIGGSWRDLVLANIIYDLALFRCGCSTIALETPAGPVLARNMDWCPEDLLAQTSYLIQSFRSGRLVYANAGWPGGIGVVSGLSGRGFAIVLNAVLGLEGVSVTGYPVLLHIRRVLEDAADFASAVSMLATERLAAPCLLTVVGTENDQRVVIERTPKRHAQRWAEPDRPLLTTNHYRLLHKFPNEPSAESDEHSTFQALDETSCDRYEALSGLFADHAGDREVGDEALLHALTDPAVIQDITAQHVIIRPAKKEIQLFVPRRLAEQP